MTARWFLSCLVVLVFGPVARAEEVPAFLEGLPLLVQEDFESGTARWRFSDPSCWRVLRQGNNHVLDQFRRRGNYRPPVRSPYHFALLKDVVVGDFILQARVRSTIKDYGHRDACVFFGFQGPATFYYVHLGKKTDNHANQIFIVHRRPRTKISLRTTPGTPWDDRWHTVRIKRNASSGRIEVYFDDMTTPVMVAQDRTFTWGLVGVGTFDDTTQWDDITLWGRRVLVAP